MDIDVVAIKAQAVGQPQPALIPPDVRFVAIVIMQPPPPGAAQFRRRQARISVASFAGIRPGSSSD